MKNKTTLTPWFPLLHNRHHYLTTRHTLDIITIIDLINFRKDYEK
jgi:hypothetical protein